MRNGFRDTRCSGSAAPGKNGSSRALIRSVGRWIVERDAAELDALQYAIGKPVGQWNRADENRVGKILTRGGYTKGGERLGGKSGPRLWRCTE